VNTSRISVVIFGITTITVGGSSFVTLALASDLSTEDRISRRDPVQDKVTICHIPDGNRTKAHDVTVGDSVVPDHSLIT
jgi:hypothetical protein